MTRTPWLTSLGVALAVLAATTTGCSAGGRAGAERVEVSMWSHSAGNPAEIEVINRIIADFNASQDRYTVKPEFFPQAAYNDAIVAAATAGDLPCLLDMDGPVMPNWAWARVIAPLDLPESLTDQFLPSTVGRWNGRIYSIGYWDAALAMFARRSVLESNGVRVPTMDRPWTKDEFDAALVTLKNAGFEHAIDLGNYDTGEWWPYAYSPMLQSFGGDLIDRGTYRTAQGALNGPRAVAFAQWFQSLFTRGLASKSPTPDRQDFLLGNVAIAWNGNWSAPDAIEKYGEDLLLLPPPDFGEGPKIGGASWQWGLSANCPSLDGARRYIAFSLKPEYVAAFSEETGLIPATDAAAALTEEYGPDGRLHELVGFSREYAVIRPPTPAYSVISSVFEKTMQDVMNGADVQTSLDSAVDQIDFNLESNDNYGL
ncbi:extracellular solute-binding protein [Planobispora siamensis]|uniref:Sugar-binding protein n=1 Tax=Planobispora siamensis TaxID=936338 RepID=A0A8J3SGX8_9ACTN|nr:extracellular solute-binding protein [Planobispora siamensis]GIH91839.1 sugar-binding protein [Planobispora siamensis]